MAIRVCGERSHGARVLTERTRPLLRLRSQRTHFILFLLFYFIFGIQMYIHIYYEFLFSICWIRKRFHVEMKIFVNNTALSCDI